MPLERLDRPGNSVTAAPLPVSFIIVFKLPADLAGPYCLSWGLSLLSEATGPGEQKQKLSLQLALGSCWKVSPLSVSGGI